MARKIKRAKAVKPSEFDVQLPDEYLFQPAPIPHRSPADPLAPRCMGGMPVPLELVSYLVPDKAPRARCTHCGTFTAAMTNHHSDTCSCLCHAARRFDDVRRKVPGAVVVA